MRIFALLLLPLCLVAQQPDAAFLAAANVATGGPAGYTLKDSQTTGDTDDFFSYSARPLYAFQVVPGSSYSLGKVELQMKKAGSPAHALTCYIYSEDAATPTTLLGTSSNVAASVVTTSNAWVPFTFASPVSLTSGTTYWVVVYGGINDDSNYFFWSLYDASTAGMLVKTSNTDTAPPTGLTWGVSMTGAGVYRLYSTP